jgi:hypothetical protein
MKNVFNLRYIKGTQDEFLVELTGALVENRGCHLVAFLLNEPKGLVA